MNFKNPQRIYKTVFIGAGPGGTGPIVCAAKQKRLDDLLNAPIAIVDRSPYMGRGTVGKYVINSDTVGGTLLECLDGNESGIYKKVVQSAAKQYIEERRNVAVPLKVIGEYMAELGEALQVVIDSHSRSQFFPLSEARAVHLQPDGRFRTELVSHNNGSSGASFDIISENLVTAVGGRQSAESILHSDILPGISLAGEYRAKTLLTDYALAPDGVAEIERRLKESGSRKVVIIGSSHSAFSSVWIMLNKVGLEFGEGDITMLYRQKPKLFYLSAEEAHADGYFDFDENDLCTLTKRVYRLAGLRLDSRELCRRIWGMSEWGVEKRVQMFGLDSMDEAELNRLLGEAAVIIPAFGYRPNTVPLYDQQGERIELMGEGDGTPALVDNDCRVLDADGQPIPHLFGIGLASGYVPSGKLGGEPSFRGQTNGVWLYQHGIGEIILNQIL